LSLVDARILLEFSFYLKILINVNQTRGFTLLLISKQENPNKCEIADFVNRGTQMHFEFL
jgi:hypothetical protein